MIILLHFHLKNAIMFGKKRHIDVQVIIQPLNLFTEPLDPKSGMSNWRPAGRMWPHGLFNAGVGGK
jgi:hypothetical protein